MGVTRVPAVRSASGAPPFYGVPDGAVRNANGTYSWTDKDGKKWIYMNSPFGLSRVAAPESSDSEPAPATSEWKVTDKGDSVRFERKGPMGNVVWEKKKTDLNEQERRAYESRKSQTKKAEPPQPQQ